MGNGRKLLFERIAVAFGRMRINWHDDDAEEMSFRQAASRQIRRLLPILNLVMFLVLIYLIGSRHILYPSDGWNWMDFITILMTVVTVILGALAVLLALAAIIGYQALSDASRKQADKTSQSATDAYLTSEVFRAEVAGIVSEQIRNYNRQKALDGLSLTEGDDIPSTGSDQEPETEWREDNESA